MNDKPQPTELTRRQVWELFHALESLGSKDFPLKFAYPIARNKLALKTEVKAFKAGSAPPKEVQKAAKQRRRDLRSLAREYPPELVSKGSQVVEKYPDEAQAELRALEQKYKGVNKALEESDEQLIDFLDDTPMIVELLPIDMAKLRKLPIEIKPNVYEILIECIPSPIPPEKPAKKKRAKTEKRR